MPAGLRALADLLDKQPALIGLQAKLLFGLRTQVGQRNGGHAHLRVAVAAGLDQLGARRV